MDRWIAFKRREGETDALKRIPTNSDSCTTTLAREKEIANKSRPEKDIISSRKRAENRPATSKPDNHQQPIAGQALPSRYIILKFPHYTLSLLFSKYLLTMIVIQEKRNHDIILEGSYFFKIQQKCML